MNHKDIYDDYTDSVGGYHDGGCGWNPNGDFCGECSNTDCANCGVWEREKKKCKMREILFRGQVRRNGEMVRIGSGKKIPSVWVYGGVLQGGGDHSVIYGCENPEGSIDKFVVYTDTIGQYTGLIDKNGVKIFEGDIVNAIMDYGPAGMRPTENVVIKWDDETGGWLWDYFDKKTIEVVGNIFDKEDEHES